MSVARNRWALVCSAVFVTACAQVIGSDFGDYMLAEHDGGAVSDGGAQSMLSGGRPGVGGGMPIGGNGGATSTGGSGGATSSGGAGGSSAGGVAGAGTGGFAAGGGAAGAGGSGAGGTGGGATGGAQGSGGVTNSGGAPGSGGAQGSGGVTDSGGAFGSGGAGTGGATSTGTFGYTPTNFDPTGLNGGASAGAMTVLDCGVSTFDSTALTFANWCGQTLPTPAVRTQSGGSDLVVIPLRNFTIASGATLQLTGSRPVVLVVFGDATIGGIIDASASATTPGTGGNLGCGSSQGGNGSGDTARNNGASGGGGGGFGTAGGSGGLANTDGCCGGTGPQDIPGGVGGMARATTGVSPLLGGCAGGQAGACSTAGGAGGGAIQISVAGTLAVTGTVRANGGNGATPCGASDSGGGTGGGSGGAIHLEGANLDISTATLQANGGNGGTDGSYFHCGSATTGGNGAKNSTSAGSNGKDCVEGSPGGGGGYGRIVTLDL